MIVLHYQGRNSGLDSWNMVKKNRIHCRIHLSTVHAAFLYGNILFFLINCNFTLGSGAYDEGCLLCIACIQLLVLAAPSAQFVWL